MTIQKTLLAMTTASFAAAGVVAGVRAAQVDAPVELSVAVTDRDGRAVRGLTATDFSVRENGRAVQLDRVTASDTMGGRSIVLLLTGAAGSGDELTAYAQRIAREFIDRAGANDKVSVVRYAHRNDEIAGTRSDMLMRIAEYRAPFGEPFNAKTWETVLRTVTRISKQIESENRPGRSAIVWIGAPHMFDVVEPRQRSYELLWPYWVEALNATARADASLYLIDPRGLTGSVRINPDGLIAQTGGEAFDNSNEFKNAIDRVWEATGNYYRLEYDPNGSRPNELQTIQVKVDKPGIQVRARKSR